MINSKIAVTALGLLFAWSPVFAQDQDLEKINAEQASRVAEILVEQASKIDDAQVSVEADPARAVGLRFRKDGILVVPQKGLSEDADNSAVRTEKGAALGYLFLSARFNLLMDGAAVDVGKLRTITVMDKQGEQQTAKSLLLAVRQIAEDDWRLYVYGSEKKPLVDAKFSEAPKETTQPVGLEVKDVQGTEGTLAITVFGKYEAGFRVGYREE